MIKKQLKIKKQRSSSVQAGLPKNREINVEEFLKDIKKLKKLLLKNDPRRFEKEEFIHA